MVINHAFYICISYYGCNSHTVRLIIFTSSTLLIEATDQSHDIRCKIAYEQDIPWKLKQISLGLLGKGVYCLWWQDRGFIFFRIIPYFSLKSKLMPCRPISSFMTVMNGTDNQLQACLNPRPPNWLIFRAMRSGLLGPRL